MTQDRLIDALLIGCVILLLFALGDFIFGIF